MRVVLTAMLLLAAVATSPLNAQTIETFEIDGAYGMIIVPANWNGSLFIYAHGYSADERLVGPVDPNNLPLLLQATILPPLYGYASATTTFRSAGWYVQDAVQDIENVRQHFIATHGTPTYTYLWGHSGGGMVTSTVIEKAPDTYDGALPMCGPGAGARRNFNGAFDLRVAYEFTCGKVKGAQFRCGVCKGSKQRCLTDAHCDGGARCGRLEPRVKPELGLSKECTEFLLNHPDTFSENPTAPGGDFVTRPVEACFGALDGRTPPTARQAARRDLFLRATQIPETFIATDMFFASIGMGEVVHRRTGGEPPWGNRGVTYASPLLTTRERTRFNRRVHRAQSSADATAYMNDWYEPQGLTNSKVLTVQALDDGLVLAENQTKYRAAFEAAGTADRLVQAYTTAGGHCGFITELPSAITALTNWVEHDVKPSTASLVAACPTCTYTEEVPGPWGLKVVERLQPGVEVSSLVCDGSPGDCPATTTCNTTTRRCE